MVILDFQIVDNVIQEDREIGLHDMGTLQVTNFVLPIRFSVENIELFETIVPPSNYIQVDVSGNATIVDKNPHRPTITPWIAMPILDFGIIGLQKIREACIKSKSVYGLPEGYGYFHFEKVDDMITIFSSYNNKTAKTNYLELIEAFTTFKKRAVELAENTFPELLMNPTWKTLIE